MANNGKIAIEKLETNDYDIILMDLQYNNEWIWSNRIYP
jgi:CheY-like chemotaxis protein